MHAVKIVETACRNLALVPFYCGLLKKAVPSSTKKLNFHFPLTSWNLFCFGMRGEEGKLFCIVRSIDMT